MEVGFLKRKFSEICANEEIEEEQKKLKLETEISLTNLQCFDSIPLDILILILSYLPLKALFCSVIFVCKKWNKLISKQCCLFTLALNRVGVQLKSNIDYSTSIWRYKHTINLPEEFEFPSFNFKIIEFFGSTLKFLFLDNVLLDISFLLILPHLCPNLEELSFKCCSRECCINSTYFIIPTLRKIRIYLNNNKEKKKALQLFSPSFLMVEETKSLTSSEPKPEYWKSLTSVHLFKLPIELFRSSLVPVLTELHLEQCTISNDVFQNLSLKKLEIINCSFITNNVDLSKVEKLEQLTISSPSLYDMMANKSFKFNTTLRSLDLSYLALKDFFFTAQLTPTVCSSIETLILRGCSYLFSPLIFIAFPNLTALDITGTGIETSYMNDLISKLPLLKKISLLPEGSKRGAKTFASKFKLELF